MEKKSNGPLFSAAKRIEDFGYNLYFSFVFHESVKAHEELQDQYITAFLEHDDEQMRKVNQELLLVEMAFEATACMLDATQEDYS